MSKKLRRCLSLVLVIMLLASLSISGTLSASADNKTGDGLAAYAMNAYNEGWRYVWGGASYGAVDCSGLIYSYVGGGARVTEDMLYSSPESGYVSNGVPDIPGLGLWQPGHVGVYVGNGMAVDARDEISNVCYSAVSSKSWVMWFKVAGVTYGSDSSVTNNNQNTEDSNSAADDANTSVFKTLSIGSQGGEVNALQERLKGLGYFEDNTTEYFGPVTQAALMEFQTSAGLYADGIYTETVKAALFADTAPRKSALSNVNPEEPEENETDNGPTTESEAAVAVLGGSVTTDGTDSDTETVVNDESDDFDTEEYEYDESEELSEVVYELGDEDEEITNIQYILLLLGYYDYYFTGTYDDNTAYAVAQYQLDHDLDATGAVDYATLDSLYRTFRGEDEQGSEDTDTTDGLTFGSEGEDVEYLQDLLIDWGFLNEEDAFTYGVYDDATLSAVEFAQGMLGFDVDGIATDELVSALTTVQSGEKEESGFVELSQSAEPDSESDTAQSEQETLSDEGTDDIVDKDVSTDNSNATDTKNSDSVAAVMADTENAAEVTAASADNNPVVDVPKTGVIELIPKTYAAVGIVISLLIIFFAANVRYWNVSMEKRRQRAKKAVSVSSYRRGSM